MPRTNDDFDIFPGCCTWAVVAWALLASGGIADDGHEQLFESRIRPVLVETCFRCHGGDTVSGGLRVDSRANLLQGGESGPALVPGDVDASLLLRALRRADDVSAMPPDKPLAPQVVEAFTEWIRAGAPWPEGAAPIKVARHWAYQPIRADSPPVSIAGSESPIDAFLDDALAKQGLTPLGSADRRTLLRRVTYDLTGLPPCHEEVEAFLRDDSPAAFARVVDRLLASPHYGEKWGRHWLDVVRYADTAGENSDHPLPHAWRYRNWVIAAFNRDLPYDQFLREQLAGDLLAADLARAEANGDWNSDALQSYSDSIVATGYLAIARRFGHDIDKDRHLTMEDTIDTFGKSVLGLTLGCARCHAHKYDPVGVEDYYALYGIFDSTRFAFPGCEPSQQPRDLSPLLPPAEWDRSVAPHRAQLARLDERLQRLNEERAAFAEQLKIAAQAATTLLARGEIDDRGEQAVGGESLANIAIQKGQLLQLAISPRGNHGADSTRLELEIAEVGGQGQVWNLGHDVLDDLLAGNPHADRYGHPAVWCFLDARRGPELLPEPLRDHSGKPGLHVWRNGDTPSVFVNASEAPVSVWTTLPPRTVFAHPAPDGAVAIGWLSPIDGAVQVRGLVADAHPGGDGVGWQVERIACDVAGQLAQQTERLGETVQITRERADLAAAQPTEEVAFAVAEGEIKNARIQERGDPEHPGPEAPRRWLTLFGGQTVGADAGSGRRQLAEWVTDPANPLVARVMANRVWQHHFGRGLVKTPNDFGTRGAAPTHPELLDWLAAEFVRSGWSVKALHRAIVLSEAYQRASLADADEASLARQSAIDPANDLYGRFERRRLGAEEIRDTLLFLAGQLDESPGGPHPFPPEATWNFTQHNPFSAAYETRHRSVYSLVLRNRRQAFFALFDGADPNASTPQRQMTNVPTQALYFMNDPLVHDCAAALAEKIVAIDAGQRLEFLFRHCFGRPPTDTERSQTTDFLAAYQSEVGPVSSAESSSAAWAAWCRVLMSSNEMLFLD